MSYAPKATDHPGPVERWYAGLDLALDLAIARDRAGAPLSAAVIRYLAGLRLLLSDAEAEGRTVPPQRIIPGVNDMPEAVAALKATCGIEE